jgi:hypothetical protein
MIVKGYILNTIDELDKLYNQATSQKKAIYFSKLALLELCGWIEGAIDNIVEMHCNRNLKNQDNKESFKNDRIKPVYGFQYNQHFRPMLMSAIGIIELEKIELELEKTGKITILKSRLGSLKRVRNDAAHTFLKGVTITYDAPSLTRGNFLNIYPILKEIDTMLRQS